MKVINIMIFLSVSVIISFLIISYIIQNVNEWKTSFHIVNNGTLRQGQNIELWVKTNEDSIARLNYEDNDKNETRVSTIYKKTHSFEFVNASLPASINLSLCNVENKCRYLFKTFS